MAVSETKPIVVADGLIKQFGRFSALRGVTEEFAPGKLYVIVGDNGAGKTTLLRAVAGLIHPTRGTITVLGTRKIKDVCQKIGYMAHSSLLYDELSGIENLNYFAELYGIRSDTSREVIARLKLNPALERPVGQYSQGMRQRLSLARAVLNNPELLLLDEPFSNVDSRSAQQMTELLSELRQLHKTVLVVTHYPAHLKSVADEFVSMVAGTVVKRSGTLEAGV
ncbi:MAG: ABC transporter ATP-binding protein [Acidobacteria bacterium]|nr:ABC transporter ATP-binding protein [Acidobacteriota bacterium]